MKRLYKLILIILCLLNLCCNQTEEVYKSNGVSMDLQIKEIRSDMGKRDLLKLKISTDSLLTYCIPISGQIRKKNELDSLSLSINDCILEVKQDGVIKRSIDLEQVGNVILWESSPVIITINKNKSAEFILRYHGELKKDFSLKDKEYYVRVLLLPSQRNIEILREENLQEFENKYHDATFITDTLKTMFVKCN